MERAAGIEPASSAWKAEVLPLHNARITTLQVALINSKAETFQAAAIHVVPRMLKPGTLLNLVAGGGFEPPKLSRQIYSLIPLAARESRQYFLY